MLMPRLGQADEKLLFAGFAFSGNYENRNDLYPYSARVEQIRDANGQPLLNKVFNEKIKSRPDLDARLSTDLGRLGRGSQVTVAFALSYENIEYIELQDQLVMYLRLNFNVLAFDRKTKQLIAAYPVRLKYSEIVRGRLTESEVLELFRTIYLTNNLGINPFDLWLDRFAELKIRDYYNKHLQVKHIDFEPEALTKLNDERINPRAFANLLANELETSIATNNSVPIVPWSPGEAVGRVMPMRFADGNTFSLNLPSPDFTVDFTVRAFRGTTVEEQSSWQKIYRVLGTIKMTDVSASATVLNENIYNTQIITLAKRYNPRIDDWPQYRKTTFALIDETSKQFSGPDARWLKESASRGAEAEGVFRDASRIFGQLK
ncbi:MAG: hypothetical protein HGB00_07445 [Chlorobiaceae bacterium]|nr:hypothetical protein [Chlorobiaceae bacterium]